MKKIIIFLGSIVILFSCKLKPVNQNGNEFIRYVENFKIQSTEIPELKTLPENIYNDAIKLKVHDNKNFIKYVCKYLIYYDEYYHKHFNQGYSFLSPMEVKTKEYLTQGNNKYFMLRSFMEFSGITPSINDGFPSVAISYWFINHETDLK